MPGKNNPDTVPVFLKKYCDTEIQNQDAINALANPNLFTQEELAEFIIEVMGKGIIPYSYLGQ